MCVCVCVQVELAELEHKLIPRGWGADSGGQVSVLPLD